jgi:protein involved in polysaccharide export with SLBB domain
MLAALAAALLGGCAALTNPVADALPARLVPPELLAPSKEGEKTVPLTVLRLPPPDAYRLDAGDVLGVYIEGILGDRSQPLPLHVSPLVQIRDQSRLAPAAGYPVAVQEDGTIALPGVEPLPVQGLTLAQARTAVRDLYIKRDLLRPETERIYLSLMHPRVHRVVVVRQESATFSVGPEGPIGNSKRGTSYVVDLPAYESDVLHALAQTGGLPGLDAYNEVIVFRGTGCPADPGLAAMIDPNRPPPDWPAGQVTRIPLRVPGDQCAPGLRPEDVALHTGDVVFLEARDPDLFYTAGLLPPGAYVLPRDHDLDVLEAVSRVRGPLFNGAFGGSNLSGALLSPGIGNPSPSLLVVVRRVPDGRQVPIAVDLRRALRDARERLVVKPGDVLLLQERPGEALARYVTQTFFNFDIAWQAIHGNWVTGIVDVSTPDRLNNRLPIVNILPR